MMHSVHSESSIGERMKRFLEDNGDMIIAGFASMAGDDIYSYEACRWFRERREQDGRR